MLDEVMVVAYGTAKKSSFTGSASTISNEKLELRPITNLTKGLEGQATGLLTTSGSGQPGEDASIVIRIASRTSVFSIIQLRFSIFTQYILSIQSLHIDGK